MRNLQTSGLTDIMISGLVSEVSRHVCHASQPGTTALLFAVCLVSYAIPIHGFDENNLQMTTLDLNSFNETNNTLFVSVVGDEYSTTPLILIQNVIYDVKATSNPADVGTILSMNHHESLIICVLIGMVIMALICIVLYLSCKVREISRRRVSHESTEMTECKSPRMIHIKAHSASFNHSRSFNNSGSPLSGISVDGYSPNHSPMLSPVQNSLSSNPSHSDGDRPISELELSQFQWPRTQKSMVHRARPLSQSAGSRSHRSVRLVRNQLTVPRHSYSFTGSSDMDSRKVSTFKMAQFVMPQNLAQISESQLVDVPLHRDHDHLHHDHRDHLPLQHHRSQTDSIGLVDRSEVFYHSRERELSEGNMDLFETV